MHMAAFLVIGRHSLLRYHCKEMVPFWNEWFLIAVPALPYAVVTDGVLPQVYSHWTPSSAAFSYLPRPMWWLNPPPPPGVGDVSMTACAQWKRTDVCGGHRCREGDYCSKKLHVFYFSRSTAILIRFYFYWMPFSAAFSYLHRPMWWLIPPQGWGRVHDSLCSEADVCGGHRYFFSKSYIYFFFCQQVYHSSRKRLFPKL